MTENNYTICAICGKHVTITISDTVTIKPCQTCINNVYNAGINDVMMDYEMSVDRAYNNGYKQGMTDKQNNDSAKSYNDGLSAGYTEGKTIGNLQGFDNGYLEGYANATIQNKKIITPDTINNNIRESYDEGYKHETTDDFKSEYEHGYKHGYDADYESGNPD